MRLELLRNINLGSVTPPPQVTGWAGTQGFGVGVCEDQATLTRLNLQPAEGCTDITSDNYGNYIHTPTQSVMVYVPAFKYRIGDLPEGSLPTQKWGVNSVQVWKANDPECPSNAVLHRAFIDGGEQKQGFFCDKYLCSPASDGSCAVSIKNKAPISLHSSSSYTPVTLVSGCSARFDSAITASRLRGNGFQCMSVFQLGAIRLLTLAHAQASKDTTYNAWYDSTGTHNGPHGNTNQLSDYDHPESTWTSGTEDGGYANKGLTGSCNAFARSTHNGQNCGIADLKGIVYQIVTGMIATSSQTSSSGTKTMYSLNQNIAIGDLDADAMYDTANHHTITFDASGSNYWYWNKMQLMIGNDTSGFNYDCAGFLPVQQSDNASDMFESDYVYTIIKSSTFIDFGCDWITGSTSNRGLWYVYLFRARQENGSAYGFRACTY